MTYTKFRPEHLPSAPWLDKQSVEVQLDDGFSCAGRGRTVLTYSAEHEDWWFACEAGQHFLVGQVEEDEQGAYFIGVFLDD